MRRLSLALGLIVLASAASAQSQKARIGASVNAYFFSDSHVREAFGDPALTYGVNLASLNRPQENKPTFAYNIISAAKGDSALFLLPFTIGYEKQFADRKTANFLPYARIEGGVAYYDVAIHNDNWDRSFKTFGGVAAAEIGVVLNKAVAIKARYNLFQDRSGVKLSGAEVGLTYSFGGF